MTTVRVTEPAADPDGAQIRTDDAADLVVRDQLEFFDDIQNWFWAGQFGLDSGRVDKLFYFQQSLFNQQGCNFTMLTAGLGGLR